MPMTNKGRLQTYIFIIKV